MNSRNKPQVRGNLRGYYYCDVHGRSTNKNNRVIPPDRSPPGQDCTNSHPRSSLFGVRDAAKCRRRCFPMVVRNAARGLSPERSIVLGNAIKTPADLIEDLRQSLGLTVNRKRRRLQRSSIDLRRTSLSQETRDLQNMC